MSALVLSLANRWVGELIRRFYVKYCAGIFIVDADLILGWQFAIDNEFRIEEPIPDDIWKRSLLSKDGILKLGKIICVWVVTSTLITIVMNGYLFWIWVKRGRVFSVALVGGIDA